MDIIKLSIEQFQFQYGAIDRSGVGAGFGSNTGFQFQYGAIDSCGL